MNKDFVRSDGVEQMDTSLANKLLNLAIILLCLVLIVLLITLPFDDCDTCKFKLNNKEVGINQFMKLYKEKCLSSLTNPTLNLLNLSNNLTAI